MRPALLLVLALLLLPADIGRADEDREAVSQLKRALRRGEAEERLEAVHRIGRVARRLPEPRRRSAAVAIKKSLEKEADPRVRAEMVRSLSRLGGATGWIPVILAARQGGDPGVVAAARQAVLWGGGDYLDVIARLLKEDKDPTFRADLLLLLGDRRKPDAVPVVLDLLAKDDHPRVRSAGIEALEALSGKAFGYDLTPWTVWWETRGRPGARPVPGDGGSAGEGATVAPVEPEEVPEPEPHVTRSLIPRFYGLPITAKDVVFVVDVSGSVGSGGVTKAKRELIRAVEQLGSDVHIAALFFAETVHMWKPELVRATPGNKAALSLFLRGIEPGKRTDVFTPLNAGLQIVRRRVAALEASGQPIREAVTMVFVSDGVETSQQTPAHIVADKLDRLDPQHTVIHAVDLGGKGSRLLMELARRGGGHYLRAR